MSTVKAESQKEPIRPTPAVLLQKAIDNLAIFPRNEAGLRLANQLRDNRYSREDAAAVMLQYAATVRHANPGDPYTDREALASLQSSYSHKPRDQWATAEPGGSGLTRQEKKARQVRQAFPTAPPVRRDPEPGPDSVAGFKRQVKTLAPLAGSPGADYLAGRGIPLELAKSANCKYSPRWGDIGSAVVFPIRGEDGKTIAATGRRVRLGGDNTQKTYGPKRLGAFFTPGALEADPVAITEAPIDALTLALAGLPAIALGGCNNPNPWIIKRLAIPAATTPAGHSRTVYLAFDNDQAGETAAARIGAALPLVKTTRLRSKLKDWNADLTTCGLDSLKEWLRNAGTSKDPYESPEASESQAVAVSIASVCAVCGNPVTCYPCDEDPAWVWYECDPCDTCCVSPRTAVSNADLPVSKLAPRGAKSVLAPCGSNAAVESIPNETASESNPVAVFVDSGGGAKPEAANAHEQYSLLDVEPVHRAHWS